MDIVKFRAACTMMVCGPTNSGKTEWIKKLLIHSDIMFSEPVESILYCYGVYQEKYDDIANVKSNIRFHEGVPSQETIKGMSDGKFHIIVLDDLMEIVVSNPNIQMLYTQFCHHYNFTAILVYQNIYAQGKCARSIALNTHITVLFENKRDRRQIRLLAGQIIPSNPKAFIEAYEEATKHPYGYLVADCSPGMNSSLSWRTNIFPEEQTIVYIPKNE